MKGMDESSLKIRWQCVRKTMKRMDESTGSGWKQWMEVVPKMNDKYGWKLWMEVVLKMDDKYGLKLFKNGWHIWMKIVDESWFLS